MSETAFEALQGSLPFHKQPMEDGKDFEGRDEGFESLPGSPGPGSPGSKRQRDSGQLRKAPQAPKRFKSSYICFFMAKQPEIKKEMGPNASITEVSKISATMWRNLPAEQKAHWEDVAQQDKERYMNEKASYTGPWQVPNKRTKKDPSAPKRPMSAFLYFALGKRSVLKNKNPGISNTDVSRLLGEMWRNASEKERKPFVDKEKKERAKYKTAMAKWRKENEAKKELERKRQAEQAANWSRYAESYETSSPQMQYAQPMYLPPPQHGYGNYPNPAVYGAPIHRGNQHVILGPNGMPHYPPPPHMMPPQPANPGSVYAVSDTTGHTIIPSATYVEDHQHSPPSPTPNFDFKIGPISPPTE